MAIDYVVKIEIFLDEDEMINFVNRMKSYHDFSMNFAVSKKIKEDFQVNNASVEVTTTRVRDPKEF